MPYSSPADRRPPTVPAWLWWTAAAVAVGCCCVAGQFTDLIYQLI